VTHGEAKEGEIEALGLGCDVSSEDSVKVTFGKIKDRFGRVDVSFHHHTCSLRGLMLLSGLRDCRGHRRELHRV